MARRWEVFSQETMDALEAKLRKRVQFVISIGKACQADGHRTRRHGVNGIMVQPPPMQISCCALIATLLFCSTLSFSQSEKEAAVFEIGPAASRSFTDSQSAFGPTVAVEVTPIENRLEIEVGVTPLFSRHSTEWSVDLLFKKPWTVSSKMEFMLGVGPEWIHTNARGIKMNSGGAEVAPDFMFWSATRHRIGWYLEPSYEYKFGPGHEHSLGIAGGLLIAIP